MSRVDVIKRKSIRGYLCRYEERTGLTPTIREVARRFGMRCEEVYKLVYRSSAFWLIQWPESDSLGEMGISVTGRN